MKRLLLITLLLFFGFAAGAQRPAPTTERTRVLIALDCSNSMWDHWQSDAKIKVAQRVLLRVLDSIQGQSDIEVALRIFGLPGNEAAPTRLEVPFGRDNLYRLQSKLKTLVPGVEVAASDALAGCRNDFPAGGRSRNIILVITDGIDSSLCDISRQLRFSGDIVQAFVVVLGSADGLARHSGCDARLSCLPDEELLGETLRDIFCLSGQMARVTLSVADSSGNRCEAEVPVVFYDRLTRAIRYSAVCRCAADAPADTLAIDPLTSYDITFFTHPPIELRNRQFAPGRHSQLQVIAPQGSLRLRYENRRAPFDLPACPVLVRQHGQPATIASQTLGAAGSYLPGRYDIEVLTTPALTLNDVAIRGGAATDLLIPLPGRLALSKPQAATAGSLFACRDDGLRWVCDLDAASISERIVLMPGDYQVMLHPQGSGRQDAVRTIQFTIQSAQQKSVEIH